MRDNQGIDFKEAFLDIKMGWKGVEREREEDL